VIGVLAGMALGALLFRDGGPLASDDGEDVVVPQACEDAIDEARAELEARQIALSVPGELSSVIDRAGDALASFDTAELERILSDLETLADEAQAAAAEFRTDEFEELAQACEDAGASQAS
jgi:hypothetical protein